ncbi:MAG: chorismate synthase [Longimicrobiaceae bacterium]
MSYFSFTTAGESHGPALTVIVEGVPAGLELSAREIDPELRRRQGGYGRGGRMRIESDRVEMLSGVRLGESIGSPISLLIRNRDWDNWRVPMNPDPPPEDASDQELRRVTRVRPGHADLAGALKYGRRDARDVLERASARETAARVAAGAVAKRFLAEFGVTVGSHVITLGEVEAEPPYPLPGDLNASSDASPVRTLDPRAEPLMIEAIDRAKRDGDTLGGVFEVVAHGVPVGLGSYVAWHRKLDGRLMGAVGSIHAVKGVEVGPAFANARKPGSRVHDEIVLAEPDGLGGGYGRGSNRAGGSEGGISTGAPLVVRGAMKPISTLMSPLNTVDLASGEVTEAAQERSDVCALPAAAVVAEAMVALVLADSFREKFGGDSMAEVKRNYQAYREQLKHRWSRQA